jgi:hypothetical protein
MGIVDALHDRIDLRESLIDDARAVVERVVRSRLDDVLLSTGDIRTVFVLLSAIVADELDDLTTKAVREGAGVMRRVNANSAKK